ncbi:MAG: CAP domain-containing protein [bacterium]
MVFKHFFVIIIMLVVSFFILTSPCKSYGEPTAEEQYMLELINRARSNPAAEGERLSHMHQRPELREIFVAYPPSPPLAFNENLIRAARNHSTYIKLNNSLGHDEHSGYTGFTGRTPSERVLHEGFEGDGAGENIAYGSTSTLASHDALIIDDDTPSLGHRYNILSYGEGRDYQEIGIGIIQGGPFGGLTVTQNFGVYFSSYTPKVLGVVYIDYNNNLFYDPGEGLDDVTITADPGGYSTRTTSSGGYSLPLSTPGSYTLRATGDTLQVSQMADITIGSVNVKHDFIVESEGPLVIRIPEDYSAIQEGIDAAVSGNSIIHIDQGVYGENLLVTKGIILEGEGPDVTIIDGEKNGPVIQIFDTPHPCTIRNLTLRHGKTNSTYSQGAGINCESSSLEVHHTLIYANHGEGDYGIGAFYAKDSDIRLINVTVTDNSSLNNVGGFGYTQCNVSILNSIIWGNGLFFFDLYDFSSSADTDIGYSNCGQMFAGTGNISRTPLFRDVTTFDYHLQPASPCKDAGHPDPEYNDDNGTRNDMGAYGGKMFMWVLRGDVDEDGQLTPDDARMIFTCYLHGNECPSHFDMNGDGQITPADALYVLKQY